VTNSLKGWKLGWIGIVVLEAFLETWIKFYYASIISSLLLNKKNHKEKLFIDKKKKKFL
jgi:hypothetical protein